VALVIRFLELVCSLKRIKKSKQHYALMVHQYYMHLKKIFLALSF